MKNKFLFLSTILILTTVTVTHAFAATHSAELDNSNIDEKEETIQENLKERVQKAAQQTSEVAGKIRGVLDSRKKYGFLAVIQRVSENTLTVNTLQGVQILTLGDQTTILKNQKPLELSEIEIENGAVIMGYMLDDETFEPRRILITDESLRPFPKNVELATIQEIGRSSLTMITRQGNEKQIDLTRNTKYQDNQGEEIEKSLLAENQSVLTISSPTDEGEEDENETALVIRVLGSIDDAEEDGE